MDKGEQTINNKASFCMKRFFLTYIKNNILVKNTLIKIIIMKSSTKKLVHSKMVLDT